MNADSVKARLKSFAIKSGCTFQEALTYYGLERAIYRISISEYAEHFVLKGGSSFMQYLGEIMKEQQLMLISLHEGYQTAVKK